MNNNVCQKIIRAALLADAHAMPLHWNYKNEQITQLIESRKVKFDRLNSGIVSNYFHDKLAGDMTHYGDQIYHLYQYISNNGTFNLDNYTQKWKSYIEQYKGYIDHSSKTTLEHISFNIQPTGADSSDFCGVAMGLPLLSLALDNKERAIELVVSRTNMTHNNTLTSDCTRWFIYSLFNILESNSIIRGMDLAAELINNDVFQEIYQLGKELSINNTESISELITKVGIGCDIKVGLPITIVLVERSQTNIEEFMIENTRAGADAAPRALIGAALIAAMENTIIPEHLLKQLNAIC